MAKDGIRSMVRIGYDGKVHKTFRGTDKKERFENEIAVLKELESRGCNYVPRLLGSDPESLTIITTNCGSTVHDLSDEKVAQLFKELEEKFGIVHDDPYLRNITYDSHRESFCIIDFELAQILGAPVAPRAFTKLDWCGLTQIGSGKKNNEDSLSVFTSKHGWSQTEPLCHSLNTQGLNVFFAISDGMGGHSGGALASKLVVSQLNRYLPSMIGDGDAAASPSRLLENAMQSVHQHILRVGMDRPEVEDMGATLVCGWFSRGELHFGHLGDSRLYRFRNDQLIQVTEDHSLVGRLCREAGLSERQVREHPQRNMLLQAMGPCCPEIHPQVGSFMVAIGDWYLLCSDGIIDGLWDHEIHAEFLKAAVTGLTVGQVAANLKNRACEEAGRDDTTLIVIKAE